MEWLKNLLKQVPETTYDFQDIEKLDTWRRDVGLLNLHPLFRNEILKLNQALRKAELGIFLFEGLRSFNRQGFLYAQGRTKKGRIVTKAPPGFSYHNYGLAGDFVWDLDIYKPGMQWTWDGRYDLFGKVVAKFPLLEWAGTWKTFKEYPHVQWKTDYSTSDLNLIYSKNGMEGVSKAVMREFASRQARF